MDVCVPKCTCNKGFVKQDDYSDFCVPIEECPKPEPPIVCQCVTTPCDCENNAPEIIVDILA